MNKAIAQTPEYGESFWEFVKQNQAARPDSLRLKYHKGIPEITDIEKAITQVECRQKFRRKLPSFVAHARFLFPDTISGEQASNEFVARYNASIAEPLGKRVVDLTAGLGIDVMSMARQGASVTAVECDPLKVSALEHNSKLFVEGNVSVVNDDSIEWLKSYHMSGVDMFDILYVDPARRTGENKRIFAIEETVPDIVGNWGLLCSCSKRIIVKVSPMADIAETFRMLPDIKTIYVVSYRGECKELLLDTVWRSVWEPTDGGVTRDADARYEAGAEYRHVVAVDISPEGIVSEFSSIWEHEYPELAFFDWQKDNPECQWLYEANASVMKAARWKALAAMYPSLRKVDTNTHLFISQSYIPDFPGRILKIDKMETASGLRLLKGMQLNAVCRNAKETAAQLSQRLKLRGSDDRFLYEFRGNGKTRFLLCSLAD